MIQSQRMLKFGDRIRSWGSGLREKLSPASAMNVELKEKQKRLQVEIEDIPEGNKILPVLKLELAQVNAILAKGQEGVQEVDTLIAMIPQFEKEIAQFKAQS